ncbi:PRC-barrel domain-containing protein [Streptomyces sp. NPDC005931]|uniref:PRC-barrel domain-containing protein n=1 Tax=Streptomyces sp. NPDC005931 TaxID=3364737 RepID=UPI003688176D
MPLLFSRVRGLPVVTHDGARRLGVVKSLAVDAARGAVSHVRVRGGGPGWRRDVVLPWDALDAVGPDLLVARSTGAAAGAAGHDLVGSRVLTECGEERGTVLDAAFDPVSGRLEAVLTTFGELPAGRLLGLGDHALVIGVRRGPPPHEDSGPRTTGEAPGPAS